MKSAVFSGRRLLFGSALTLALLFVATLGEAARAQASEEAPAQPAPAAEKLPVEDFSKPMGPPDPFNRGTPRGSMYGFTVACRAGDYERAAEYLDLRRLPPAEQAGGPQLARQFRAALNRTLSESKYYSLSKFF